MNMKENKCIICSEKNNLNEISHTCGHIEYVCDACINCIEEIHLDESYTKWSSSNKCLECYK